MGYEYLNHRRNGDRRGVVIVAFNFGICLITSCLVIVLIYLLTVGFLVPLFFSNKKWAEIIAQPLLVTLIPLIYMQAVVGTF